MSQDIISKKTRNKFREYLVNWTLREIEGKEKYGKFTPMIGANALLALFKEAIRQDFFSRDFLRGLAESIREKLESQ